MFYKCKQIITTSEKNKYKELLDDLEYEQTDIQIGVYDGDLLVGGISLDNNCIKLLKVEKSYEGQGISNILISEIIKYAYDLNIFHLFVFTKPINAKKFYSLGFYTIFETSEVLFLENHKNGLNNYLEQLEKNCIFKGKAAGLVMNLNPMTLGHDYLISKASSENDFVHVIIVKEEKSLFPYKTRLKIAREVTKKYKNVCIHEGSDYVISGATFPTYFIKDKVQDVYANLDANIYGAFIAKALNINVRYIGEEPYSLITNVYNKVLKQVLPNYNLKVVEIKRKSINDIVVSATKVREFLKEGDLKSAKEILPKETYEYLKSSEGQKFLNGNVSKY